MASWSELLIIGDSIALGAAEVRGGEVTEYVRPNFIEIVQSALPHLAIRVDAAVMRTTATVKPEINQLIQRHQPLREVRVLLLIGGSDADMDWKRFILSDGAIARSRIPLARYDANLRFIVEQLLEAGAVPILTDMPNHHFALRGPYISAMAGKDITPLLERGGGQAESDKHLVQYRAAVAAIAADYGLTLIRYGESLDKHPAESVCAADGVHPGAFGHRIIAAEIIATLTGLPAAVEAIRA
jgi:hypothetical protein